MRAYVFTDPALAKHAGQFVWLAIDGEKAVNAEFRRRYRIPAYPTFYVIDPASGDVLIRWVGSASVSQFDKLFGEQSAAYARRNTRAGTDAILARADSLYGADQHAAAAAAYGEALASAPADWVAYGRAVDARLFALDQADSAEACVALAEASLPRLRNTPHAATVVASGLSCAIRLPADAPRRKERIAEFERATRLVLADPKLELTGDDRSGLWISLMDAREADSDSVGQRQVAGQWSAFLDGEAAKAKTPEARAVFDSHRLSAYIEIGHPEKAIPMLETSARDFPDDYNPHARLASAYKAMKQWDKALAESDLALARAYGPRKLLIYQNRVDILKGKDDVPAARSALEEAIAYAKALPEGQRSNNTIASLEKKLEGLK
ncbi:MAG TPA: thiol reductase thioredoxin [Candidatus Eisenbacteria bacterium]|nr:thiol reductase thioredoxin [Candidatus Eisenbacteria bacterium]